MSTSFEIFPVANKIPTFDEVNKLLETRLVEFFQRYNIANIHNYSITLLNNDRVTNKFDPSMHLSMLPDYYCHFYSGPTEGIFLYYMKVDRLTYRIWQDEIEDKLAARRVSQTVYKALKNGYYWKVKRYDNQEPIIDLLFGYVTGVIAELVDGIIHTDDYAWEPDLFPVFSKDFFKFYFIPEVTKDLDCKEWSIKTIVNLGGSVNLL
ncbi:MAG: hypothetical protein OEM02_12850 [Desulfobulbaceae bacterium]|nr:hypothetical protein [Desulfobulbaceae bacterium]